MAKAAHKSRRLSTAKKGRSPSRRGVAKTPKLKAVDTFRLRDQEYHLIAEAIPTMVWTARPDGVADYYNHQWYDYSGMTWERCQKEGIQPVTYPEDYERANAMWDRAIATGEPYEMEYRFRRASDGMYRWHLGRAIPLRNDEGYIIKWFGVCTDIHDQKQAAEKILRLNEELEIRVRERTHQLEKTNEVLEQEMVVRKKAEEQDRINLARLRNIIDTMPYGAVISDEHRTILHVNDQFCTLFQLDVAASDLIGQNGADMIHIGMQKVLHPDAYSTHLTETLQSNVLELDQEVLLKDGRVLSRDYVPVIVSGIPRGHLFLYRDVTQERRIDAAKSEFMSLASHQLRTPLTLVRWSLARLSKEPMRDTTRVLVTAARDASVRMVETINTMLTISSLEADKTVHLTEKNLRVADLLLTTVEHVRAEFESKDQEVMVDCASDVWVHADEKLLKEIINNLVGNAVKYSAEGSHILLQGRTREGQVDILVRDEGFGIPAHQHDKIFSKFFRAENALARETEGTGLGLYLAWLLTKTLGGHISFVSQEGKGTTFTVSFPQASV